MEHSDFIGPVNIGSEEMVTINALVQLAAKIAGKEIDINLFLDHSVCEEEIRRTPWQGKS